MKVRSQPKTVKRNPAFPIFAEATLRGYLGPKLAADAKLDLKPVITVLGLPIRDKKTGKVTGLNFDKFKVALDAALKPKEDGKPILAQDADVADVQEVLSQLEDMAPQIADLVVGGSSPDDPMDAAAGDPTGTSPPDSSSNPGDLPAEGGDDPSDPSDESDDGDAMSKVMAFLSDKLSPEDLDQIKALLSEDSMATDNKTVSKPAMDAAIAAALDGERKRAEALRQAEQDVLPLVGPVNKTSITMDSAEKVYTFALGRLGVKTDGLHPTALQSIVKAHVDLKGKQQPTHRPNIAADSAGAAKPRFGNDLARLKTA